MIGIPYDALTGGYGLAWQVVSWGVIAPLLLVGLLAWVVLLDRRFGWGLAGSLPDPAPPTSADEVGVLDGDQDVAENGQGGLHGSEADPDAWATLAGWIPHPDDPLPVEASRKPEEDEEPASALPQVGPQHLSTEARTRPRRSRRRRRLRG